MKNPEIPSWDQMEGEPNTWFQRFRIYLTRLSPYNRTLIDAEREYYRIQIHEGTTPEIRDRFQAKLNKAIEARYSYYSWSVNSKKWKWKERAADYDLHQRRMEELADFEWRQGFRRKLKDCVDGLIDRVDEMMKFPLHEVKSRLTDNGEQVIVVMPTRWSQADVARFVQTAIAVEQHLFDPKHDPTETTAPKELHPQLVEDLAAKSDTEIMDYVDKMLLESQI